jgi:hypothetical protein
LDVNNFNLAAKNCNAEIHIITSMTSGLPSIPGVVGSLAADRVLYFLQTKINGNMRLISNQMSGAYYVI